MLTAGFKPKIPARERPQSHILDRAASWLGRYILESQIQGRECSAYCTNLTVHVALGSVVRLWNNWLMQCPSIRKPLYQFRKDWFKVVSGTDGRTNGHDHLPKSRRGYLVRPYA